MAWSARKIVWVTLVCTICGLLLLSICGVAGYHGYRLSKIIHRADIVEHKASPIAITDVSPGDLLLFSSNIGKSAISAMSSIPTMLRTNSPWTHIALVARNPKTSLLYSVEFTLEPESPGFAGIGMGVMPLARRVKTYNGRVFSRALFHGKNNIQGPLWDVVTQLLRDPSTPQSYRFTFLLAMWHRVGIPGIPMIMPDENKTQPQKKWICTDFIAHLLHQIGVFDRYMEDMLPVDFGSAEQRMPLSPDCHYGPETLVRSD